MNIKITQAWRAIAVSVTGTSHEKGGKPCQDAHNYQILPNGVLVAAVADGAGSATHSDLGAHIAVYTAVEKISQLLPLPENDSDRRVLMLDVLTFARESVVIEAEAQNVPVRDLASTLILVVATHNLVLAAQIGDGAAVVRDINGNLTALTTPLSGEYANETTFLVSPNAIESAQINIWHDTPAQLAIFSDGLQRLALKIPEATPHEPFFSPLFQFVSQMQDETVAFEELKNFLKSSRVTSRTDDDLTLFLATNQVGEA